ncbi:hypothetical protein NOF04DRAFT_17924 [Fusarium oxysporum II5]|uniref:Uncharacterized protein n=3 Tax=Fusarium oxysporum species complex TaxID=171631 RepID=N1S155_FUSC4|nr:uncharacterized protein FOIG_15441 [Fusarium odoratissimum NRRL 54006]EMT72618.1 hypothetical protein FOC4_g10004091 [Fusarium odoratissimum]EXL91403.1 hypothetical protein FOIG_15441 [Fusarium odoratissimum NRRL 54006]KAK2130573.1 hypothetical protein NOF04DRAFT_17924 [Fusarium oxysporum II5]TXC09390.1 hypothetical protein FocTR4_00004411 [Fusarium oxysporum f. sp. cubense]
MPNQLRESNPILTSISNWILAKSHEIAYARSNNGGWEGWSQVELAWALTRDHTYKYNQGSDIIIKREARLFEQDSLKADLEISGPGGVVFELKCERGPQMVHGKEDKTTLKSSAGQFFTGLKADQVKVAGLRATTNITAVFVIGISVTKEAHDRMAGIKENEKPFKLYTMIEDETETPICLWWWQGSMPVRESELEEERKE